MSEKIRGLMAVERLLQQSLEAELQFIVPVRVHCAVRENTFLISIHVCESSNLSPSLVLPWVEKKIATERILQDYPLQTYFIVHEKTRFEALSSSALVPLPPSSLVRQSWTFSLSPRAIGWGLAICASLAAIYSLSRPCLWGNCPNLKRAQQLGEQAIRAIEPTVSYSYIVAANQDLSRSLALLDDIPPWSPYHSTAVDLITTYQDRSKDLDRILSSLKTTSPAMILAQEKHLTLDRQEEIGQLWRNSLNNLAQFSQESPFYPFVFAKIREYRRDLAALDRRIEREQQALQDLASSQKLARMAISRQKSVKSLTDWQFIDRTWREAVNRLQKIPSDAHAAKEARRLLETYGSQWASVRSDREREELALARIQQAGDRVKLAENAVKSQKWSESATQLQHGLTLLQQIPRDSLQYPQAERAIARYQLSLQQARGRERVSKDLEQICAKRAKICTYELGDERVRIYLIAAYTAQVRNTARQAQTQANMQTQLELMNHLSRLENAFQMVSDSTAKAVEVYNFDRVLMAVYEPKK
jgi:hypothetical protein